MPNPLPLLDRIATRLVRHFPGPRQLIACTRPIVSFTFDDVPETALTNGASILEAHGARGTFYVSGGLSGSNGYGCTMLSSDGYRELAARGHELACHTYSHASVRGLSAKRLAEDLDRNAGYLANVGDGLAARNFAFPKTVASPHVRGELRRRFRSCRGGRPGINRGTTDRGYLSAVEIRPMTTIEVLTAWIDDLVAAPGWLIFFTHDVSDDPTMYGCPTATLERLIGDAQARGCTVLTVDRALDEINPLAGNEAGQCR